jgi:ABC-type transporter Mla MlaB component
MSVQYHNQTLTLSGELTFNTVQLAYNEFKNISSSVTGSVTIDLSQVTKVDTAALALCTSFQALLLDQAQLSFLHAPADLLGIAESVGVSSLFI